MLVYDVMCQHVAAYATRVRSGLKGRRKKAATCIKRLLPSCAGGTNVPPLSFSPPYPHQHRPNRSGGSPQPGPAIHRGVKKDGVWEKISSTYASQPKLGWIAGCTKLRGSFQLREGPSVHPRSKTCLRCELCGKIPLGIAPHPPADGRGWSRYHVR